MDAGGVSERSPSHSIHSPCSTPSGSMISTNRKKQKKNRKKQKKKEKSPMDSSASAAGHHHLRAPRTAVCAYSRHAANASRSAQTKRSDGGMAIRLAHAGRQDHSVLQIADMLPRIAQKYCAARNGSADLRSVASNPPARRDTGPPWPQMPSLLSPVGRGLLFVDDPIAYSPENSSEEPVWRPGEPSVTETSRSHKEWCLGNCASPKRTQIWQQTRGGWAAVGNTKRRNTEHAGDQRGADGPPWRSCGRWAGKI